MIKKDMEKIKITKNFTFNTIGSILNAIISVILLIIITRVNGLESAGIFSISYAIACLLYVFAIYSGRNCHITDIKNINNDKNYILARIITCFISIVILIIFVVLSNYDILKIRVLILLTFWKCLEAFTDVLHAIMQKENLLYKAGISLILKSIISLICFFIIELLTANLVLALTIFLLSYFMIIIIYDIPQSIKLIRKNQNIKINMKSVFNIYINEFFVFANTLLVIYILNAPKYSIENYLTDNIQAIFAIILMPASILPLFSQFVLAPIINNITNFYKENKIKSITGTDNKITVIILCFGVVAILLAYLIGIPILNILYNQELIEYKLDFILILLAYIFYALAYVKVIILTVFRKLKEQFTVHIIIAILSYILSDVLVKKFKVNGIAIVYLIVMSLYYFLLSIITKLRYKNGGNKMKSSYKDHTFVICAYKESKYLEECVMSLLNQNVKSNIIMTTSTPNEHIEKIAKKYDIPLYINKGEKGIGQDWNFGVSKAETQYVTIAHQDDIYKTNYLEEIVKKIEKSDDFVIAFTDYKEVKDGKEIVTNANLMIKRIMMFPWKYFNRSRWIKKLILSFGNPICCPSVTLNIKKVGKKPYITNMKCSLDWDTWLKLADIDGRFVYISKKIIEHRIHEESETTKLIGNNIRLQEDEEIFRRLWPNFIANCLVKQYKKSLKSNTIIK